MQMAASYGGVQAGHHGQRLGRAGDKPSALVQELREEVALRAVAVVDDHVVGAGLHRALDRGVGLKRHQAPGDVVVLPSRARLLVVDDTADPLHVDGNEHSQCHDSSFAGASAPFYRVRRFRAGLCPHPSSAL